MNAPAPDLQMFAVAVTQQADGTVYLRQVDHAGEVADICLHPQQISLIADSLGLLGTHDQRIERMVRALAEQLDELAQLAFHIQASRHDFIEPEIPMRLLNLLDLVALLMAEYDDAPPLPACHEKEAHVTECHEKAEPCHENSKPISVTSTKRGRPAKEGALTPTERQRRRREKQGSLPL
jgi:hypothetical protein